MEVVLLQKIEGLFLLLSHQDFYNRVEDPIGGNVEVETVALIDMKVFQEDSKYEEEEYDDQEVKLMNK
ncbi:hypothetical protein PRIPAC_79698 [Pristionchus pacificus]|nr:hypothetical protein PRIPAC_79698 [Pristionchus pacificus]|eukprot:PDM70896.1 hypothetical protein PRIPAC_44292 [Pristionchus pacificus]